jgi:DNA-binding beta-propeller fold protein YncE
MKTNKRIGIRSKFSGCLVILISMITFRSAGQTTMIWEKDSLAYNPESIVYDKARNCCYVSNFGKNPGDGMSYNTDYVSKFNLKGALLEKKVVPNLTAPTGLCIFNDYLYIVERFGIVKFDLKSNKESRRYRIKTTKFLNDVAVDSDGNIYVTVSDTNIIYRIKDDIVEKWFESPLISKSNGIMCDGDKIIVGVCSDNTLKSISIADRKLSLVAVAGKGFGVIDGLKKYGNDYLISHYEGTILLLHSDGRITEVMDTSKEGVYCADFEFIEDQKLIIIPTLKNNKVSLYKYISVN